MSVVCPCIEVTHIGIGTQFANGCKSKGAHAIDEFVFGVEPIEDPALEGFSQVGTSLSKVLQIKIYSGFLL